MSFLDSIRADVKKEVQVHERQLVLKVLQRRSQELTMGELFKLLGSPLGEGLHALRVAELFAGAATGEGAAATASPGSPHKDAAKAKKPKRRRTKTAATPRDEKKRKPARTTGKKATKKRAEPLKVSAITVEGRKRYDGALLTYLREHPGPNRPAAIRSVVGGSILQLRRAMERLREAGLVERQGQFGTTTYAAKDAGAKSAAPAPTGTRAKTAAKATGAKASAKTARPPAPSVPPSGGDAAVLAALRDLGGWVSSTQILNKVGGSIDTLRESLKRLVTAGSVRREGERKFTRYTVAPDAA